MLAAVVGAVVAALAVGTLPGFAAPPALGVVGGIVVFAGLLVTALRALVTIRRNVWPWAIGFGIALASFALLGVIIRGLPGRDHPGMVIDATMISWLAIRWLGLAWLATCAFAVMAYAVDRAGSPRQQAGETDGQLPGSGLRAFVAGLPGSLISPDRGTRRKSVLVILALMVLARVPYLVILWPGVVLGDTHRSYAELQGTLRWTTYEPVGHTLLVGLSEWVGTILGFGTTGDVAIAALAQIAAMAAAFGFLLVRLASWGVPRALWFAALGWLALMPLISLSSVGIMKDEPFSAAFVFFMVGLGEVVFGARPGRRWWPWVMMAVSAVFIIGTRSNGSYVVLLSLPILLIVLRRFWRQLLAVLIAVVVAYGAYVGPVYRALGVRPGPKAEAFSLPIQQLARIAKTHRHELSETDRHYLTMIFGAPPKVFTKHYVPYLADPMKLSVREAWKTHSTAEMLSGWPRLVAKYPRTAVVATLANTVGFWDPTSSAYDGVLPWLEGSTEIKIRTAGVPTTGLRRWLVNGGILPVQNYWTGQGYSGYLQIPVVGSAMSPGFVIWIWIGAFVMVIRRRGWSALSLFVPAALLLLTLFAGPVSGGERYTLPFLMALPLAAAIPFLVQRVEPTPSVPTTTTAQYPAEASIVSTRSRG